MNSKLMLVVISAVVAATGASPYYGWNNWYYQNPTPTPPQTKPKCNDFLNHKLTLGPNPDDTFNLNRCTKNGVHCVSGVEKIQQCSGTPNQCYSAKWYASESRSYWTVKVCYNPWGPGFCYTCSQGVTLCAQVVASAEDAGKGAQLCEKDENGVEHCRSFDGGQNALAIEEAECFCVTDPHGKKICDPKDCDAKVQDSFENECFCLTSGATQKKMCQPPNCDALFY